MQEMCILVDDNDKVVGFETKKNCKSINDWNYLNSLCNKLIKIFKIYIY